MTIPSDYGGDTLSEGSRPGFSSRTNTTLVNTDEAQQGRSDEVERRSDEHKQNPELSEDQAAEEDEVQNIKRARDNGVQGSLAQHEASMSGVPSEEE